jgi:secondary thiamine-phosphate synthase enzyme
MSSTIRIPVQTSASREAIDITDQVVAAVEPGTGGLALVHTQHTTIALVLGPADEGMLEDFVRVGERWLAESGPFAHLEHDNANGEAHVMSAFGGTRLLLPVDADGLRLGTWQRILLLEFDGPRTRNVDIDLYSGLGPRA